MFRENLAWVRCQCFIEALSVIQIDKQSALSRCNLDREYKEASYNVQSTPPFTQPGWVQKIQLHQHQRISPPHNNLCISEISTSKWLKDTLSFMTLFLVATKKSQTILLYELAWQLNWINYERSLCIIFCMPEVL